MSRASNSSLLRYGFELDKSYFVDIGTNTELVMSLLNVLIVHPIPLLILFRKSRNMKMNIRRGYIAMHISFMTYELIFFFLVRIYALMPWSGLYCEGPLCRLGLPRQVILALISLSIVILQPPFAFLIIQMHQLLIVDSPLKLSKRVQIGMATVQLTIMTLNVVGFTVFGREPDNADSILQEPEIAYYASRGKVLLFGGPGDPQYLKKGSSAGIGRETARRFAENGAKVTITGRNVKALQVVGDIRSKETQEAIVNETMKKFGKIDVLVNNAGAIIPNAEGKRGLDVPVEELRAVMDLNLDSVVAITQLATPHLEKTKGAI
ncbi:hypothetical protein PRIPAC_77885, partial [Pristionchus pacificus]|uniref:Dehydrogenase n=1 Tax=Pristionchus pacificus TaxID=54126 RepID=A0A2A6CLX6_PRIPA